jgi:hypothetical protein
MAEDIKNVCEEPAETKGRLKRLLDWIEHDWLEVAATILLAVATVMSAYSAYQSANWHGIDEEHFSRTSSALILASELDAKANNELNIDVMMASDYLDAVAMGDMTLAANYKKMGFSDRLNVAIAAWEKAMAEHKPNTPRNPFLMPEYVDTNAQRSRALKMKAINESAAAVKSLARANDFLLLTVLFAIVLFFAGVATKFNSKGIKVSILVMGMIVFVSATTVLFVT